MVKLEPGKYYRTRDGHKLGPCQPHDGTRVYPFNVPFPNGSEHWHNEYGRSAGTKAFDIIAEWNDDAPSEPAPSEPAPEDPPMVPPVPMARDMTSWAYIAIHASADDVRNWINVIDENGFRTGEYRTIEQARCVYASALMAAMEKHNA